MIFSLSHKIQFFLNDCFPYPLLRAFHFCHLSTICRHLLFILNVKVKLLCPSFTFSNIFSESGATRVLKKLFPIKLLPITEEEKVWKRLLGLWRTPRNLSFKCERNNFWFCTTLPKGKGSKPKEKKRKVYTFVCSDKNVGTNLTKIEKSKNWNKCFKYEA